MTGDLDLLTADESERLADLEAVVRSGLETFVTVGRALTEIRDARLYRAQYGTFEAYCEQQWQLSRPRAYELINAASTTEALSAIADTPIPANEGQARQLTGLPAGTAAEVMRRAHDDTGGKLTAAAIREARQAIAPKPAQAQPPATDPLAERIAAELAASDADYAAMAAGTDEEFEQAITAARDEGDLSRENVAAKLPEPPAAVDAYLASLPEDKAQALADSGYRRSWAKTLHRAYSIVQYDAERLGQILDDGEAESVYLFAATAQRLADTVRRSRSGLRVINGGGR